MDVQALNVNRREAAGGMVLAGGKSSRMGQDKALLPYFEYCNMLFHTLDILRSLAHRRVVVADEANKYKLGGVPVIADLYPNAGPVGGIVTGLTHFGAGWHFALACDMPRLNNALLLALLLLTGDEWDAVVPEVGGRLEPLCALYRDTALPKLRTFLDEGGRAAHKAIGCLNARIVGEEFLCLCDPELTSFTNVNTPDEWQKFKMEQNLS